MELLSPIFVGVTQDYLLCHYYELCLLKLQVKNIHLVQAKNER